MEPPMKKSKLNGNERVLITIDDCIGNIKNSTKHLKAILSDNIYNSLSYTKVYVGRLKSAKDISRAILILNDKLPLKELQHLKRARGQDIILCPSHYLTDKNSIEDFIVTNLEELKDEFGSFNEIDVPSVPPKVKSQFMETKKVWPCNFHPNIKLEKLVNNDFFNDTEMQTHRKYMRLVFDTAKWCLEKLFDSQMENVNATVVVDPNIDSVVTVVFDNRLNHPIQHSAMLAVDSVARTQNGGAWPHDCNADKNMLTYLKENYPDIGFGYKHFRSKEESKNSNGDGPYLCTGYNVYILREPCFMCAMALVHARVKQVFFCLPNLQHGALRSRTKLQEVSSLNHHFSVFTGFF